SPSMMMPKANGSSRLVSSEACIAYDSPSARMVGWRADGRTCRRMAATRHAAQVALHRRSEKKKAAQGGLLRIADLRCALHRDAAAAEVAVAPVTGQQRV